MTIKDRVLVVEDEKSISGLIKAILTANGYDVITAINLYFVILIPTDSAAIRLSRIAIIARPDLE